VPGADELLVGHDVGGGESEQPAALVAVDHLAAHLERRSQETRRVLDVTR